MAKDKKHKHDIPVEDGAESPEASPQAIDDYSPESYESIMAERDEMAAKYQRALADYQNAQRRFSTDMGAAREAGVEPRSRVPDPGA
ncbi:MAG: hypothetical protein HND58_12665 [Planctomycetota bacterium]|nr:MAG: hypothetical protein HND58_12665 [Planctomycetota bacterium]